MSGAFLQNRLCRPHWSTIVTLKLAAGFARRFPEKLGYIVRRCSQLKNGESLGGKGKFLKMTITKKEQSNSRASRCQLTKLQPTLLFMMICLAPAISNAGTSRLYPPSKDEAGALRLAQVMLTATREQILKLTTQREHLLASGLQDSDFKDGSLAMGRVYCCHPSTDEGTAVWFYVPPDAPVTPGDIVVIRMGRESTKQDPGKVNVLIEVRQKAGASESHCSWDPPNDTLWRRVLYCDWMPAEGWTLKKGGDKTWLKPASDAKAQ